MRFTTLFLGDGRRRMFHGRDLADYHCRCYSGATLQERSIEFGLSHANGSANWVRRAKARLKDPAELRKHCEQIERKLALKTEKQVWTPAQP